jgi:hypothetical protein
MKEYPVSHNFKFYKEDREKLLEIKKRLAGTINGRSNSAVIRYCLEYVHLDLMDT